MITVDTKFQIDSLTELVKNASEGERVIVEINGKLIAIVPVEDAQRIEALEDARDLELARQRSAEISNLAELPTLQQVMKDFGLEYE
jgi:hypothetical protein